MLLKGFFLNLFNPTVWLLWLANVTAISISYGTEGLTTSYSVRSFALPGIQSSRLLSDKITKVYNRTLYNTKQIVNINDGIDRSPKDENIFLPSQVVNAAKGTKGNKRQNLTHTNQNRGGADSFEFLVGYLPEATVSGALL